MLDQTLAPPAPTSAPLQRLADSLRRLVPPSAAAELAAVPSSPAAAGVPPNPKPSPAVAAALARSAALAEKAARDAQRMRNRSGFGVMVEGFAFVCASFPYAPVALALRLMMARVFFLDGQLKFDGPRIPVNVQDFDFSLVLPVQLKAETFATFYDLYSALPVPSSLVAYVVSYGEFLLPLMLILGFGSRFAALGLMLFTALLYYAQPAELWTSYVYWGAILLVLLTRGPGAISVDHILRFVTRR